MFHQSWQRPLHSQQQTLAAKVHENLVKWYFKPCQELVAASVIRPRGILLPFFILLQDGHVVNCS